MKHALRKYLSRRGSALFMVLSLMTALMILVMAMYFSVVGSRDVQYKVFYQEQSYRSAISLSDAIIAGLDKGSWNTAEGSKEFLTLLTSMENEGDVVTTDGNGFAAFSTTGAGKEEVDQLGAYNVTITRMADEMSGKKKLRIFDIAITTSTGGVIETTHSYISMQEPEEQKVSQGAFNPFTSTGYVPNDSYLEGGEFFIDVVIDNENAALGAARSVTGQMSLKLYGNLSTGGSLYNEYLTAPLSASDLKEPVVWAIRNKYTQAANQTIYLGTNSAYGLMMVGGDYIHNMGGLPKNCYIYVLGDMYLEGNQVSVPAGGKIFVYGNIYFEDGAYGACGSSYKKGTVYCSGMYNDGVAVTNPCDQWRNDTKLPDEVMTPKEMAAALDSRTASVTYSNWKINDSEEYYEVDNKQVKAKDYIPELDPDNDDYNGVKLYYNTSTEEAFKNGVAVAPHTWTKYLDWEDGNVLDDYFGEGQDLNYTACVIEDLTDVKEGNHFNNCALVINTGDDPNNQYIIQLRNNRDFDKDENEIKEAFSWYPRDSYSDALQMSVIVRGKGSVVIDIPEDVVYQDVSNNLVIHETLFFLMGGKLKNTDAAATDRTKRIFVPGTVISNTAAENMLDLIHTKCDDNCSHCNYQTESNPDKCTVCESKGIETKMVEIYCPKHEFTYSYCPVCNPEMEPAKDSNDKPYGLCVNRIDRVKADAKIANISKSSAEYMFLTDNGTKSVAYPTTNIFLVSCSESADIRMSGEMIMPSMWNGQLSIMQNGFYGFIYAPYMTFKAYGNGAGGGFVRFCGGMIVSDYIFKDSMSILTCLPEYLPTSLMSSRSRSDALSELSSKSWKISLIGY